MDNPKEIYLTDLTFHAQEHRSTNSLEKASARKEGGLPSPRLYFSIDKDKFKINSDGTFKAPLNLSPDIEDRVKKGEIKLVLPKDGLIMWGGKDAYEKSVAIERKERRELIHRSRGQVWREE